MNIDKRSSVGHQNKVMKESIILPKRIFYTGEKLVIILMGWQNLSLSICLGDERKASSKVIRNV